MSSGIIIFGASGTGKTTLGREVAGQLGYHHIDIDDYIWRWDTEAPYTILFSREERTRRLMEAIERHPRFVMSGAMGSIRKAFNPLFDMAVFITVPTAIRMERLRVREAAMLGDRILPGGDMYEHNIRFLDEVALYDTGKPPQVCLQLDEQWASELACPVLRVDGTQAVTVNAVEIAGRFCELDLKGK